MITVNAMNAQRNPNCAAHSQGFALIATISVMVLLVMVCLAMLSLTTIELRGKSNTIHQQVAQTNARMAAMLAVAELQRKLGADRSCLLYTSPSPRDKRQSRMPSSA